MVSGLVTSRRVCLSQSGGRKPLMPARAARPQRHDEAVGSDGSTRELTGCRKFGWKGQVRQSQHHSHGQKTGAGTAILDVGAGTELPNCFEMAAASWSWSARPRARTFRSAAAWLNVPEAQTERRTLTRYEESAIVSLVDVHVEYPATRVSR